MKNVRRWGRVSRIGDRLYPYRVTWVPRRWVLDRDLWVFIWERWR